MNAWVRFLSYNNAVPIAVSVLILGGTGVFAATDPSAIYSSSQQVISVDNSYIANKDLSTYTPKVVIDAVTEDADNYYVAYSFYTIDVQDAVWRDVVKKNTLTVQKSSLGNSDLGLYATEQFNQLVGHEQERLDETKAIAQTQVSQKVVATAYSGLIGKFLDESTETLPGYTPVIAPPVPPPPGQPNTSQSASVAAASTPPATRGTLSLQIMGANPARIPLHASYVDLGVFLSDPPTKDIADLHTYLNGVETSNISIDTSTTSVNTIRYAATDSAGNSAEVSRSVEVYDPNAPVIVVPTVTASTTSATDTLPVSPPSASTTVPSDPTPAAPASTTSDVTGTTTPSSGATTDTSTTTP